MAIGFGSTLGGKPAKLPSGWPGVAKGTRLGSGTFGNLTPGPTRAVTGGTGGTVPTTVPKPKAAPKPNPATPKPVTPTAPAPPAAPPRAIPPLDSTAMANIAANNFKDNQGINNAQLAQGQAGTALQAALAQLSYQQPRDSLALEQNANRGGGLYSSVYNQNLANLGYKYAGQQGGAVSNYTNAAQQQDSAIAGLQGDMLTYAGQQAADSAARLSAQLPPADKGKPAAPKPGGSGGSGSGSGGSSASAKAAAKAAAQKESAKRAAQAQSRAAALMAKARAKANVKPVKRGPSAAAYQAARTQQARQALGG